MGKSKYYVSNISTTRIASEKKTLRSSQAKSERGDAYASDLAEGKALDANASALLRVNYWKQVKQVDLENLVFLDEMGVLLGLIRTHARAAPGERAYDYKPFYRGSKVSVIGAITVSKVLAVMTLNDSMDASAFQVYISKCLVPQLWKGAVVVMDNLPAHKVKAIAPLIEAVGAKILYLSPYSPEFNPIEHWWCSAFAQIVARRLERFAFALKAFLRQFSPKTSKRVDLLIKIAMHLIDPQHLRNWFAHCCYCHS